MVTDTVEKAKLSEISEVKVYIHEQINATRDKLETKIDANRAEMNTFRAEVSSKFDVLHQEMNKHFRWTMGIMGTIAAATITALVTVVIQTML